MTLLEALKNFADALIGRRSQDHIDQATADLHEAMNPTPVEVQTPPELEVDHEV